MGQDVFTPLIAVAAMAGTILGFIIGWLIRRSTQTEGKTETERLLRSYQELTNDMTKTQLELKRKREIATRIPMIVRSLTGKLAISAIPPIAIRFMKEFFHASQVGFFAPARGETQLTLVEGVGFPANWKGKIRISPQDGVLGMALSNRVVTTKEDHLSARTQWPAGVSSLERNGVMPDLVAPVTMDSEIVGALVVVSSEIRLSEEIAFASMMADLLGNAFQHATTIESAEQSASIDPLTKVYSRGYFTQRFEAELRRARNYSHPLTLLLFDIDHFKKVNDTYGHPAGDLILVKLGQVLADGIRSSDFAARYGGEEFTVVMTQADKEKAHAFAEILRSTVESTQFQVPGQEHPLKVTISGGVANFPQDGGSTSELIRVADEALYQAKQLGRNRIVKAQQLGLDGKPLRDEA
ncbi:MAG: GGDEF domain-containing protein [Candidatus Deferrimicrobiaceae bacterium]